MSLLFLCFGKCSVCPLVDVDVFTISLFWKMFSVSTD